MHGLDRRTRQLELSAGLQRNRAAAGDIIQSDDVAVLHDRLPAEQELHALEQRADAARAFVSDGMMAGKCERRFFVFGADPEVGRRLRAGFQPRHQLVARLQRRHIDLVTRHANSGLGAFRPNARGVGGHPRTNRSGDAGGRTISSCRRAVSCGKRWRLTAGAAQPVEQSAEF